MTNDDLIKAYEQAMTDLIEETYEAAQSMFNQLRNGGKINDDMWQQLGELRAIISSADGVMYKLRAARNRKENQSN